MSPEAEALVKATNEAATKPAVMMAGIANALRLVGAWVLSIETRLEKLSNGERP